MVVRQTITVEAPAEWRYSNMIGGMLGAIGDMREAGSAQFGNVKISWTAQDAADSEVSADNTR